MYSYRAAWATWFCMHSFCRQQEQRDREPRRQPHGHAHTCIRPYIRHRACAVRTYVPCNVTRQWTGCARCAVSCHSSPGVVVSSQFRAGSRAYSTGSSRGPWDNDKSQLPLVASYPRVGTEFSFRSMSAVWSQGGKRNEIENIGDELIFTKQNEKESQKGQSAKTKSSTHHTPSHTQ